MPFAPVCVRVPEDGRGLGWCAGQVSSFNYEGAGGAYAYHGYTTFDIGFGYNKCGAPARPLLCPPTCPSDTICAAPLCPVPQPPFALHFPAPFPLPTTVFLPNPPHSPPLPSLSLPSYCSFAPPLCLKLPRSNMPQPRLVARACGGLAGVSAHLTSLASLSLPTSLFLSRPSPSSPLLPPAPPFPSPSFPRLLSQDAHSHVGAARGHVP